MSGLISYLPHPARLTSIVRESADTRTFVLELTPPLATFDDARPGQFVMLSLLGHGEAAFTLSRLPGADALPGTATVTVRRVGDLTTALFTLAPGAVVGLRGPFGRGFPTGADGLPTIHVAGGCGLAPLRAAIDSEIRGGAHPPPIVILYGAREPDARIFTADLARWRGDPSVHVIECVEQADRSWAGRVGTVLDHLADAIAVVGARRAIVCGPPILLAGAATALLASGIDAAAIHLALERYMKCGTGQCGHCYVGDRYVCTDGPVFSLAELLCLPDALPELREMAAVAC